MQPDSPDSARQELHARAGEIFFDASELPANERTEYLRQTCGDDAELLREVTSLLAASERGGTLLQSTAIDLLPQAVGPCVYECAICGMCSDAGGGCEKDGGMLSVALFGPRLIDGKYLLEQRLSGGGMGMVYRARHVSLERAFALKLLHSGQDSADFVRLFEGEAKALGALRHPGVVTVTDYGVDPRGNPYLTMDLLDGATLDAAWRQRLPSCEEYLTVMQAIAAAVDYVHAQGIVHGDIKPSNILLAPRPVLIDFGLAAIRGGAGTPGFMAPEVASGARPTAASDIYSFGALASSMAPSSLRPLVTAVSEDPGRRPASASEYVGELREAWLAEQRKLWRTRETPRRLLLAAASAIVFAGVALVARKMPLVAWCENNFSDSVLAVGTKTTPDPRLLLISLDDASLAADPRPLPALADDFGKQLEEVFQAGARAVAIDFLLPASWGTSRPFAKLLLAHAGHMTLALLSYPDGRTLGAECINPLLSATLGTRASRLFAFVNLQQDGDGVVRRAFISHTDRAGGRRFTWPVAAAAQAGEISPPSNQFPIDYSTGNDAFERVSWKDVPQVLQRAPDRFRGRLVLVGGEYTGSGDTFHAQAWTEELTGLSVQALIANTVLRGFPLRDAPGWILPAWVAALAGVGAAYFLLAARVRYVAAILSGVAAILIVSAFSGILTHAIVPGATPLFCWLAAAGGAILTRRRMPPFPSEHLPDTFAGELESKVR